MKKLIALLLAVAPFSTYAFKVTPMVVEFDSSGRGTNQTFQVDNNSDLAIPLEVEALARKVDINNKETRTPTKDFVVYPLQMVVKPNEKRNVRVSWIGNTTPETELAYRLAIRQLPVEIKGDKRNSPKAETKIKFLFEYVASLYVRPKKVVEPKLVVESLVRSPTSAEVMVKNTGNIHVLFKQFSLFASADGKRIEIPEKSLEEYLSYNILAQDKRKFKIPLPAEVPAGQLTLEFKQK